MIYNGFYALYGEEGLVEVEDEVDSEEVKTALEAVAKAIKDLGGSVDIPPLTTIDKDSVNEATESEVEHLIEGALPEDNKVDFGFELEGIKDQGDPKADHPYKYQLTLIPKNVAEDLDIPEEDFVFEIEVVPTLLETTPEEAQAAVDATAAAIQENTQNFIGVPHDGFPSLEEAKDTEAINKAILEGAITLANETKPKGNSTVLKLTATAVDENLYYDTDKYYNINISAEGAQAKEVLAFIHLGVNEVGVDQANADILASVFDPMPPKKISTLDIERLEHGEQNKMAPFLKKVEKAAKDYVNSSMSSSFDSSWLNQVTYKALRVGLGNLHHGEPIAVKIALTTPEGKSATNTVKVIPVFKGQDDVDKVADALDENIELKVAFPFAESEFDEALLNYLKDKANDLRANVNFSYHVIGSPVYMEGSTIWTDVEISATGATSETVHVKSKIVK